VAPSRSTDAETLLAQARQGQRGSVARLLTLIERGGDAAAAVDRVAFAASRGVPTVGITGSPGAGKSTLVSALIHQIRAEGSRVAVLAIDPSSPFTGGAILGDRVRMGDHALDDGVFIRSMATRGHLGGLAVATPQAARLLDAVGFDLVLIETVGVGQVEVEVAGEADVAVVVVNPGWGDAVQANKAGLMEIADLFVINKADRPGAENTRRDLEQMLELSAGPARPDGVDDGATVDGSVDDGPGVDWRPPIVATVASAAVDGRAGPDGDRSDGGAVADGGDGIVELWSALGRTLERLERSGARDRRRAARLDAELDRVVAARLAERVEALAADPAYEQTRRDVRARRLAPWDAADRLVGPQS
jgi:LAO/AO transport system kinase